MVPSGRKYSGKSAKPSVGDQAIRAYEFEQEDKKDLSGSEEDAVEGTVNLRPRPAFSCISCFCFGASEASIASFI